LENNPRSYMQMSQSDLLDYLNKGTPNTLPGVFGIKFVVAEPDRVVATMPIGPNVMQPVGFLHGGASVALAETIASVGTALNIDSVRQLAFGLEINANHLRPKRSGMLTAEARPIHKGRTTFVWNIEIRDEANKMVCISRCTVAVVDKPT